MLLAAIVMVFFVLLALTVAAPSVAMQIKRERELESAHRANQYVRAIRQYYLKFKHYPGSVEQLEKTNNQRFLRQKYIDPLTGKDDWRLIHVGENKTKVKGFFGEELPGLPGGLGAAAGLSSGIGASTTGSNSGFGGSSSGSAFGNSAGSGLGGANGTPGSSSGIAGQAGGAGATSGGSQQGGSSTGVSSSSLDSLKGGGGPIMGVGSSKTGEAILVVNEQTNYQDWEFLYDPRIEQLRAKASLLGGVPSGGAGSGGLGTGNGTGNGNPGTGGNGYKPNDPGSGSGNGSKGGQGQVGFECGGAAGSPANCPTGTTPR